jgi:mannosyltransferase OCH1-like enzyme
MVVRTKRARRKRHPKKTHKAKKNSPPDDNPDSPLHQTKKNSPPEKPDMTQTIPRKIHQVYGMFDDGVPIKDISVFDENAKKTKAFCKKQKIPYEMWGFQKANKLIEKLENAETGKPIPIPFSKTWKDKRFKTQPILRADFIRYCILYEHGGIYVDCDIHPIKPLTRLFQKPYFFVTWPNDKQKRPYNAILGTYKHNPLYRDILRECCRSFKEKKNQKIYETWKGRFVFQTTGHFMLKRVLKSCKEPTIEKDVLLIYGKGRTEPIGSKAKALFEDANASVWYSGEK